MFKPFAQNILFYNYIMASNAKLIGYEHGYLKTIGQPSGRMTLETTSQDQFKHNKELSKAWQEGVTKYYQDMQNKLNDPDDVSELKVGEYGPFADFYKKKGGKKSKRRGAQKKRKTRRSRK